MCDVCLQMLPHRTKLHLITFPALTETPRSCARKFSGQKIRHIFRKKGLPPISRERERGGIQSAPGETTQITLTHMLNTDLNAVNGFGEKIFRRRAAGNTWHCWRHTQASALLGMSWHYNASAGHSVRVSGCVWTITGTLNDHAIPHMKDAGRTQNDCPCSALVSKYCTLIWGVDTLIKEQRYNIWWSHQCFISLSYLYILKYKIYKIIKFVLKQGVRGA